jgi:hypothetical protein
VAGAIGSLREVVESYHTAVFTKLTKRKGLLSKKESPAEN